MEYFTILIGIALEKCEFKVWNFDQGGDHFVIMEKIITQTLCY